MFNAAIINIGLSLSGGQSFSSIKVPSPIADQVKLHMDTVIAPIKKVFLSVAAEVETYVIIIVNFSLCQSGYQSQGSNFFSAMQQNKCSILKSTGGNVSFKMC